MINFTAKDRPVHSVSQVIEIPSKTGGQSFIKRELILDDSRDKDGKHYESLVCVEFTGDRVGLLDSIQPGQRVDVDGFVSGREHNGRVFNTIRGLNIAPSQPQYSSGYAPTAQQPMATYTPPAPYGQQRQGGYPQQHGYGYPQHGQPYGQPQYPDNGGLPF